MTIRVWGIVLLATCACGGAQAGLRGVVGARMDACFRNLVAAKDPIQFADVFESHAETTLWQSEFWGKYMHTAVPVAEATGDETLKRKVVAALRKVIAAQEPDGYIGNYRADSRCNERWDVWGIKYTLLGLLYGNRLDPGSGALSAAEKLADYLISHVGPNGLRPIRHTGFFRGLASCSVLEPVVWLYRETGKGKYLDFAKYIVAELDEPEDSAHLLSEAGQDVFARASDGDENRTSVRKAYEMMSCYHGLLCFYEVTGDRRCLTAAVKTAESILRTEENVVGGMTSCERWYGGAKRQTECFVLTQETCVLTTWMRLCQKLLELTGERATQAVVDEVFSRFCVGK